MEWINQDLTYMLLKKALDVCLLRHKVISNNIANVDTPGFKASKVIFEEKLRAALNSNSNFSSKIRQIKPEVVQDNSPTQREDFNNVDIEKEMVKLSQNTLYYNIYVQLLSEKLEMIREAIQSK
ncbi:flagellar basal body rod protein FlgB [Candidatus Aerophobetes bacterium]|nr:flagellar basal body rod protein FlgB [Candidatus Aerophobetes bacterium]